MKYAKPLSIVAALAVGLISIDAFAASPNIDINMTSPAQTTTGSTYYIAEAGTSKAHRVYNFKELDRNHNGQLTRSEIPNYMWRLRVQFIQADFNGNGQLSPSEIWMWEHHTAPEYVGVYPALTFVSK